MSQSPQKPPLPDPSGLENTLSPVDLPGDLPEDKDALRWATTAIAVATLVLLPLNATAIRGWAYELKPGPATGPIVESAEDWYDATAMLGLNLPVETMRGWWQSLQEAEFSSADEEPAEAQP